ncbi:MAG: DUF4180 domain-containing protein [Eubacteriaceae bacterium]
MKINKNNNSIVALFDKDEITIKNVNDVLDIMANVSSMNSYKIVIYKESLNESFFDLKTKLAGEILQKLVNYNMKIAIIGNFEEYNSKSLHDFIFESNNGKQIFFKSTLEEGLISLHSS